MTKRLSKFIARKWFKHRIKPEWAWRRAAEYNKLSLTLRQLRLNALAKANFSS